jgi:hypothetical protein
MELSDQLLTVGEAIDTCAREVANVFVRDESRDDSAYVARVLALEFSSAMRKCLASLRGDPPPRDGQVTADEAAVLCELADRLDEAAEELSDGWRWACLGIGREMLYSAGAEAA